MLQLPFWGIDCPLLGLALHRPADQRLRESAHKEFGASLQAYSNIEEGIRKVEEFLNSKKEKYIVSLSDNNVSVPEVLINYLIKSKKGE